MEKTQWVFAVLLLFVIGSIIFFSQSSQKIGLVGVSLTPTIDMQSQFQIIQPSSNQQQVQAAQTQQQPAQSQQPQVQSQTYGVDEPLAATIAATIKTSKGDIHIHLFSDQAPKTVRNFINKAQSNYYNNLTFHRVEDWVVQGGDPKGDGTGGGQMSTELNNLPFITGSIGVARGSTIEISNDSQFFITKSAASWLTGQYTNFGTVTDGMNVVNQLQIGDKILSISIDSSKL